jgi:hypothetical protein
MKSNISGDLLSRDEKKSSLTDGSRHMVCIVCHKETPVTHGAGRPRKYCSTACRQRAYRQRHQHLDGARHRAPAGAESAEAGQVIAVLFVPAAVTAGIDKAMDLGTVLELGILNMTHTRPRSTTPPPSEERDISSPADPQP